MEQFRAVVGQPLTDFKRVRTTARIGQCVIGECQLTLSLPKDQVKVRLFGRNLLDKKYYSQVSPSPTGDIQQPAAPRTYGIAFDFAL